MSIEGGSGNECSGRSRLCLLVVEEAADAARLNDVTYCPSQVCSNSRNEMWKGNEQQKLKFFSSNKTIYLKCNQVIMCCRCFV